jgi:hypothetical protein
MNMVYAQADLPIDVAALQAFCAHELASYPQAFQGSGQFFGGWSVTSGTGDYRDGWQQGQHAMRGVRGDGTTEIDWAKYRALFPIPPREMRKPTQLYQGPIKSLMEAIERRCQATGIAPSRARLSKLDPQRHLLFHRDAPDEDWRLHVPIVTNDRCFFEWDLDGDSQPDVRLHMRPGTAWFVRVDRLHRFVNDGHAPRIHLLMSLISWRAEMVPVFNAVQADLAS